jgi:predicted amidohydrolase
MPDFDSATAEAIAMAETAVQAGADIIFLPEYCGGLKTDGARLVPPAAPEQSHPFLRSMAEFAAEHRVWILVGSVAVEGPAGKIFNRGVLIDDRGQTRDRYDKIHLFDIQLSETEVYRESESVLPGDRAVIHNTPFGRIGHTICYDLRFPQLYRALAQGGADILSVPAAFTKKTGEAHWHALNRARAIENGAFVVSPCAIGPIEGGGESYGHSLVVTPWGEVIADGGDIPGVVQAQIDLDKVAEARAKIPSLTHDGPFTAPDEPKRNVA